MRVYEDENKSLHAEISKMDIKLQEVTDNLRNAQLANEELEYRLENLEPAAGESLGAELGEISIHTVDAIARTAEDADKIEALSTELALIKSEVNHCSYLRLLRLKVLSLL